MQQEKHDKAATLSFMSNCLCHAFSVQFIVEGVASKIDLHLVGQWVSVGQWVTFGIGSLYTSPSKKLVITKS